jgi:hypothetical protein
VLSRASPSRRLQSRVVTGGDGWSTLQNRWSLRRGPPYASNRHCRLHEGEALYRVRASIAEMSPEEIVKHISPTLQGYASGTSS